jgi:hypothetical protein
MADPWKVWTQGLYQKNQQERQLILKAYERIFDGCMRYIGFVQRHTLNKYCAWEVPNDALVDRTLCRDYIIRRLVKLGLAVTVPQMDPWKLVINWIDPAPILQQSSVAQEHVEVQLAENDEEEEEEEEEEKEEQQQQQKKSPSTEKKRKTFEYLRLVANPSKIIGE